MQSESITFQIDNSSTLYHEAILDTAVTSSSGFKMSNMMVKNETIEYSFYELYLINLVHILLYEVVGGIVFTLGILLNILSFTYFQLSRSFKDTSMRYYFSVISITDSLRLLDWPIIVLIDKKFLTLTNPLCKIILFVTTISGQISIWLLVLLSIERYIILSCPFRGRRFYTIKTSIKLLCILLLTIVILNLPYWSPDIIRAATSHYEVHVQMCHINVKYHIYMFINTVLIYCLIPFLILFLFNLLLIALLSRQKNQVVLFTNASNSLNIKREKQFKEKTILLIIVSFFLILTVLPRYALQMLMFFYKLKSVTIFAITKCLIVLEMFNFSFNFFFYIICSKTSRRELYLILYYFFYWKWSKQSKATCNCNNCLQNKQKFDMRINSAKQRAYHTLTNQQMRRPSDIDAGSIRNITYRFHHDSKMSIDRKKGSTLSRIREFQRATKCRSYSTGGSLSLDNDIFEPNQAINNSIPEANGLGQTGEPTLETFLIRHASICSRIDFTRQLSQKSRASIK